MKIKNFLTVIFLGLVFLLAQVVSVKAGEIKLLHDLGAVILEQCGKKNSDFNLVVSSGGLSDADPLDMQQEQAGNNVIVFYSKEKNGYITIGTGKKLILVPNGLFNESSRFKVITKKGEILLFNLKYNMYVSLKSKKTNCGHRLVLSRGKGHSQMGPQLFKEYINLEQALQAFQDNFPGMMKKISHGHSGVEFVHNVDMAFVSTLGLSDKSISAYAFYMLRKDCRFSPMCAPIFDIYALYKNNMSLTLTLEGAPNDGAVGGGWANINNEGGPVISPIWVNPFGQEERIVTSVSQYHIIKGSKDDVEKGICTAEFSKDHYVTCFSNTNINKSDQEFDLIRGLVDKDRMMDLSTKDESMENMGRRWVYLYGWGNETYALDIGNIIGVYNPMYGNVFYFNPGFQEDGRYGKIIPIKEGRFHPPSCEKITYIDGPYKGMVQEYSPVVSEYTQM